MNQINKAVTLGLVSLFTVSAQAGTSMVSAGKGISAKVEAKAENPLDKLWGLANLYKSDSGLLNELSITGRYQGQYYNVEGDESASDYDNRRARVGLRALLLDKTLELKSEAFGDLNSGGDSYKGLTELYLGYKLNDDTTVTIGKQKPKFGQEWSLSSRLIPTFERSLLVNGYKPDHTAGVSLAGKAGATNYYVGVFSNEPTEEFAELDGGLSITASLSQDATALFGTEKATVGIGYIHSEHEDNDSIFTTLDDGISIHANLKQGALGLSAEALYLMGEGDTLGLSITPTYDLSDKLQLVFRYQVASSDGSMSPQKRYESPAGVGSGDLYNAIYGGFNYFIYDQKLKLMGGVEYADMDGGGDSLTVLAGIRMYW